MKELISIQAELKAPKGQRNTFCNYNYRSCEDILEAVKPILAKHKCFLVIQDDIVFIGDRYYVKATAVLTNEEDKYVKVSGFARESLEKKGMDTSQITGTASSYARKYALNGLFCIDDTKDADTMDNTIQTSKTLDNIEVPNICAECNKEISDEEKSYSTKFFKKTLCRDCQKNYKK